MGFIYNNGEFVIPCKYSDVHSFHEGFAEVWSKERGYSDEDVPIFIGYISKDGTEYWED